MIGSGSFGTGDDDEATLDDDRDCDLERLPLSLSREDECECEDFRPLVLLEARCPGVWLLENIVAGFVIDPSGLS